MKWYGYWFVWFYNDLWLVVVIVIYVWNSFVMRNSDNILYWLNVDVKKDIYVYVWKRKIFLNIFVS